MKISPFGATEVWQKLLKCSGCKSDSALKLITELVLPEYVEDEDKLKAMADKGHSYWLAVAAFLHELADAIAQYAPEAAKEELKDQAHMKKTFVQRQYEDK